jgi:EmrB/QacA subfamily drug resistance transporter
MPIAGRLSDQYGRKRIFLAGIILFTAGSLACGLSQNIYELIALRAVQAVGAGTLMPSSTGVATDEFGPDRDRVLGMFSSMFATGAVCGPILGGVLVTFWSWRAIFFINVPLGLTLCALVTILLPRSRHTVKQPLDVIGITLLGAGLLAVMFALSYLASAHSAAAGWTFAGSATVGVLLLVMFGVHSATTPAPLLPPELLSGRGFGIMHVLNFLYGFAVLGIGALVPLYAQQRFDLSTIDASNLLSARAVATAATAALATIALRRTGFRSPILVGLSVLAIGTILFAVQPRYLSPAAWLSVAAAISGLGMGISLPASNNALLHLAPASAGATSGLRGMIRNAGGLVGVAVITAIAAASSSSVHAQSIAFFVFGLVLLVSAPLVLCTTDHRGSW